MGSLEIVNSVITYEEEDDKNSKFLGFFINFFSF